MIRKLFRVSVAGACLLSLVMCLGAGLEWWRYHHVYDVAAVHIGSTTARAAAFHLLPGFVFEVERGMPGPPAVVVRTCHTLVEVERVAVTVRDLPKALDWSMGRALVAAGTRVSVRDEFGKAPSPLRVRYWSPVLQPWQAFALFALPPLLWLGTLGRRRFVARRRRRRGRCIGCGYDTSRRLRRRPA